MARPHHHHHQPHSSIDRSSPNSPVANAKSALWNVVRVLRRQSISAYTQAAGDRERERSSYRLVPHGQSGSNGSGGDSNDPDDLDGGDASATLPYYPGSGADNSGGPDPFPRSFAIALSLLTLFSAAWTLHMFWSYPFPTTIPVFVGLAIFTTGWAALTWVVLLMTIIRHRLPVTVALAEWTTRRKVALGMATLLVVWWSYLGMHIEEQPVPALQAHTREGRIEKYFIAANLHEYEGGFGQWAEQLKLLLLHLGHQNTFVSIYESNSHDATKTLLHTFRRELDELGVSNRIVTEDNDENHWAYGTGPGRISYLADARNHALLPIQSTDEGERIPDWGSYTKLVFLNDIIYRWEDVVRLIATPTDDADGYDQVCGMDFGASGLYDTWVARDACGTPLRPFWPFIKDSSTRALLRQEEPFPLTACWNGIVVFKAEPFIYRPGDKPDGFRIHEREGGELAKRGWKMVDDPSVASSRMSPNLTHPLRFRDSGIDACDHSECFLISYDLHRLYNRARHPDRPPRIWMNPQVRVAYEQRWWDWNNVVTRRPIIRWWIQHWSHSYPLYLVDWIWEAFARQRDYCTWSALRIEERCPPLPGAQNRHWWE